MRIKWKLKHDLFDLRKENRISLQKLADEVFSSNSTLFRIEKTGVVTDEELARQIAKFFDIGFEEMFEKMDELEECIDEWKEQVNKLFARTPDEGLSYFIFFVKVYEQGKSYTSFTPTHWRGFSDTEGMEIRNISLYEPKGIKEYLMENGVEVAVAYTEMDVIYFYYGFNDEIERAILIPDNLAQSVIHNFSETKEVKSEAMVAKYGFNDCCIW